MDCCCECFMDQTDFCLTPTQQTTLSQRKTPSEPATPSFHSCSGVPASPRGNVSLPTTASPDRAIYRRRRVRLPLGTESVRSITVPAPEDLNNAVVMYFQVRCGRWLLAKAAITLGEMRTLLRFGEVARIQPKWSAEEGAWRGPEQGRVVMSRTDRRRFEGLEGWWLVAGGFFWFVPAREPFVCKLNELPFSSSPLEFFTL